MPMPVDVMTHVRHYVFLSIFCSHLAPLWHRYILETLVYPSIFLHNVLYKLQKELEYSLWYEYEPIIAKAIFSCCVR